MKYRIEWGISTERLEMSVKEYIAKGWKPLGGLCYDSKSDLYLQALIKEEE